MSSVEVDTPILCSPFAEPGEHGWIEEGLTPERREGRRPAGYWYRDPQAPEPEEGFTRGAWQPLDHVDLIRERVKAWRAEGYPGVTRTSLELLAWWQREGRHSSRSFFPRSRRPRRWSS